MGKRDAAGESCEESGSGGGGGQGRETETPTASGEARSRGMRVGRDAKAVVGGEGATVRGVCENASVEVAVACVCEPAAAVEVGGRLAACTNARHAT